MPWNGDTKSWRGSTSQPPLSKTSCHDSKSFSKPPPPKPYMQEYAGEAVKLRNTLACKVLGGRFRK